MADIDDFDIEPHSIFDPYELSSEHLDTIRKIARVVMETQKCDYTKAAIIAYIEWIEMTAIDKTQH